MQSLRPFLSTLAASLLVCTLSCGGSSSGDGGEGSTGNVTLTITNGDETTQLDAGISSGATVLELVQKLSAANELSVEIEGEGGEAFVKSLNGAVTEGEGRNWLYAVNGKLAPVGIGNQSLSPGDSVAFCYLTWDDRGKCGSPGQDH